MQGYHVTQRLRRKEIKIVREYNYTFLNTDDTNNNLNSKRDKSKYHAEVRKARQTGSKKLRIRDRNRINGGQNKQGHSSVYE